MVVIDEQHRFGVEQRAKLWRKNSIPPHILVMTATPIPRTLAMTLYGDLDVSVLDEMPAGRRPVTTRVINGSQREEAYALIREEVAAGRQAFVVCPLVADSEALEVKAATTEHARISAEVFPDLRVGLIHGRLRSADKERVMAAMRAGEIDVLVATTGIEVGGDIPNATVMLIEDADRFGLSQLHQLRGRIGRSEHAATCLLLTSIDELDPDEREHARQRLAARGGRGEPAAPRLPLREKADLDPEGRQNARQRLAAMEESPDGFCRSSGSS